MADREGDIVGPQETVGETVDELREAHAESPAPPPAPPPPVPFEQLARKATLFERVDSFLRGLFVGRDPGFWTALLPYLLISLVLFSRLPTTNYIFDEQEALLANPYVNGKNGLRYIDAIHRDFWGLPPDRSIGSYRPIPNFMWRALWVVSKEPFFHHIYNVFFHAVNAALLSVIVFAWTKRRRMAWAAGLSFVCCAVLTEAVSGIVGIADVLGGMGALFALAALSLPAYAMPFAVFAAVSFGLFSKESALVCVPLIPFAALLTAPLTHSARPARLPRALLSLVAAAAAFYVYVELRKRWFPSPLPQELQNAPPDGAPWFKRAAHEFLVWFHQAPLPKDPLNNPLIKADPLHRVAGALRVYWRGLTQLVFPKTLSGDYSFPQEPAPKHLIFPESVLGGAMMVLPPLASIGMWIAALVSERNARKAATADFSASPDKDAIAAQERRVHLAWAGGILQLIAGACVGVARLVLGPRGLMVGALVPVFVFGVGAVAVLGLGLLVEGMSRLPRPEPKGTPVALGRAAYILVGLGFVWIVVSYFPHSNIPIPLPTVRAERFWYLPALGSSLILAVVFCGLYDALGKRGRRALSVVAAAFLFFQGIAAYRHAMDYRNDLDFWAATKEAVPESAKAHLNYSVMKGARGDLETRLRESKVALELAEDWPMAHIYTGDTLCRMHRANEAWPYYQSGFEKGPNDLSLIALALQCLYDEKALFDHEDELRDLAEKKPGTWIAYLAIDTLENAEKNSGVDKKYRPRGYNEGPKD